MESLHASGWVLIDLAGGVFVAVPAALSCLTSICLGCHWKKIDGEHDTFIEPLPAPVLSASIRAHLWLNMPYFAPVLAVAKITAPAILRSLSEPQCVPALVSQQDLIPSAEPQRRRSQSVPPAD